MGYPQVVLENQFGEVSNNFIKGGSSQIFAEFTVAPTNNSGSGISGLSASGVAAVYMHSTAAFTGTSHTSTLIDSISDTSFLSAGMHIQGSGIADGTTIVSVAAASIIISAATGSSTTGSITYQPAGSPNPAAGYALVKLAKNYSKLESLSAGMKAPASGNNLNISSGVTAGLAYIITSLGSSTDANWHAIGLEAGLVAAVGQSFIATVTGNGTGTGVVQIPAAAGSAINHVELIGDADLSANPSDDSGALILVGFYGEGLTMNSYTPAGVITNGSPDTFAGTPAVLTGVAAGAVAAPATGTVVRLNLSMIELPESLI